MEQDKKLLRLCTAVIVSAMLIRLLANLLPGVQRISDGDMATALLFLQTGRVVRYVDTSNLPQETVPEPETQPAPAGVCFTGEDVKLLQLRDYAGKDPDLEKLLLQPLAWHLTGEEPTVLILHTHGSESYENTEGYTESSQYRTLQEEYNMISIGDHLTELLQAQGIGVIHDRTIHDYPSYNGSYDNSRAAAELYLQLYPSICLILDLHRDAAVDSLGNQVGYTVQTPQGQAAKLMLVMGTGHEAWEENLSLALKLQVQLEKNCPGICRPISLRKSKFNQQLCPGAVLVEVGAAGNTRQEALLATEYLAQAIVSLTAGSTS